MVSVGNFFVSAFFALAVHHVGIQVYIEPPRLHGRRSSSTYFLFFTVAKEVKMTTGGKCQKAQLCHFASSRFLLPCFNSVAENEHAATALYIRRLGCFVQKASLFTHFMHVP